MPVFSAESEYVQFAEVRGGTLAHNTLAERDWLGALRTR